MTGEQIISLNDIINLDKYVFLENHVYLDRKQILVHTMRNTTLPKQFIWTM